VGDSEGAHSAERRPTHCLRANTQSKCQFLSKSESAFQSKSESESQSLLGGGLAVAKRPTQTQTQTQTTNWLRSIQFACCALVAKALPAPQKALRVALRPLSCGRPYLSTRAVVRRAQMHIDKPPETVACGLG